MSDEKNSQAIMVRVTPTIMSRIEDVATQSGLKPATLARMGLMEVLERLSAQAPQISPDEAKAIAAVKARGVNLQRVLTDALEADLTTEAAHGQPVASAA